MSRLRRAWAALPLAALLIAAAFTGSGCSVIARGPSAGDRLFAAGDWIAAEAAYRETLRDDARRAQADRALFRLALVYSLPESPLQDLERAEDSLSRLLAQHPSSEHAPAARALLAWHRRADEHARELAARAAELERARSRAAELAAASSDTRADLSQRDEKTRELTAELAAERRRSAELEAELERLAARASRLETELEQLKKIDLEPPP